MVSCILCLKNITFLKNSFGLNSNEGRELDIFKILTTIFNFLQLNSETNENERICCDCWNNVENFNNFCQRILAAHKSGTALLLIKEDGDVTDPISNENFAKSHDNSSLDLVNGQTNVSSAMNEIKVEVDELDLLPSIEILENPVNTNNRNSPLLPNQDYIISSTNAIAKRIKLEEPVNKIIDDSDSDVPLSVYLSHNDDEPIEAIKLTNDPKYGKQRNCEAGQESQTNISYSNKGNGASNDGWQGDTLKEERYAEIPKRGKLLERLSQQKEYDEIIAKFFEKFSCPVCNRLVKEFSDLRNHFRVTHNNDSGYMSCCRRKFYSRKLLAEHVLVHWNPEHFKCGTCNRIFRDSRSFEVHENTHKNPDSKDKKIYQCDQCPRSFKTKSEFEFHFIHSKHVPKSEFKFSCKECNQKFATERKLRGHMKYTHHAESVTCDKCGKKMRNQSILEMHHKLEHSDEPRPDSVLRGLKQYMKSVHNETDEDHRCPICNRTSPTARALKYHIYFIHEHERKFKCTMCKRAFKKPQELMEHKSIHMRDPIYTCPNCPMTFLSSANMYRHRQRSHRAEWESDKKKPNVNMMIQTVSESAATSLRETAATEKTDYVRATVATLQTTL